MRSEVETLLTISEFAKIMGLHEWYLAQFGYQSTTPAPALPFPSRKVLRTECQNPTYEYRPQDEKLSRFEIARAINEAEEAYARLIGFWPAPKYFELEEHDYPINFNKAANLQTTRKVGGDKKEVALRYGYVQEIGTKQMVLIDDTVAVTYNILVPNVVLYEFSATVVVPVGTLISEIAVFFTATDRLGKPLEEWQIRPVRVSIDTLTNIATITGDAFLMASPSEYLAYAPQPLVVEEPTHFVTQVEVWRVTTDTTDDGVFYWNDGCETNVELACYGISKTRTSVVVPQKVILSGDPPVPVSIEAGCQAMCGGDPPRKLKVNYLAGIPRKSDGRMDFTQAQRIAWLAAGYLACKPCGCACGSKSGEKENILEWWSEIPMYGEKMDRLAITYDDLSNPLGPARGAIKVWRAIRDDRITKGYAIP